MTASRPPNLQLIYVSDIHRSTKYYSEIFNYEPIFKSPRYVVFTIAGEAQFAIWSGGHTPDNSIQRFCEIGIMLSTDTEVNALYQEWSNNSNIKVFKELHSDVFGQIFLVSDPDGHIIRVCSAD